MLLAVLAALYLIECLIWVQYPGVLVRLTGVGAKLLGGGQFQLRRQGGLSFAALMPPFPQIFLVGNGPLIFGWDGYAALNLTWYGRPSELVDPVQNPGLRPYPENPEEVHVHDRTLYVGKDVLAIAESGAHARLALRRLRELALLSPKKREQEIQRYQEEAFDLDAAKERQAWLRKKVRVLHVLGFAQFINMFGLMPAVATRLGVTRTLIPLAAGMLLLHFFTILFAVLVHRRIDPEARQARVMTVVKMFLSPPMSCRSAVTIPLEAMAAFHPLTILALEAQGQDLAREAQPLLRDQKYPLRYDAVPVEVRDTEAHWRALVLQKMEALLQAQDVDPAKCLAAPPDEENLASFCPRCGEGNENPEGACPNCPGLILQPLHLS